MVGGSNGDGCRFVEGRHFKCLTDGKKREGGPQNGPMKKRWVVVRFFSKFEGKLKSAVCAFAAFVSRVFTLDRSHFG